MLTIISEAGEQKNENTEEIKKSADLGDQSDKCYKPLLNLFKKITVEPVIFCYACAMILHTPVIQQYVYNRVSQQQGLPRSVYESEASVCDQAGYEIETESAADQLELRKIIQSEASFVHLGVVLSASVPSLFMALLLGAWSDKAGRKIIMILPIIGGIVETIVILITMYGNLPLYTLFFGSFVNGFCGFFTTMVLAIFSYIADITEESKRALRLGIMEAIAFLSGMISHLTSGWWIKHLGFKSPYWFILILHTINMIYVTTLLKESRENVQKISLKDLFDKTHISRIYTLFQVAKFQGKWEIFALLITSAFMMVSSIGFGSVIVLYALDTPFCCSPIMIGYFLADSMFVQAVGALTGFVLLRRFISELTLTQLGIVSIISSLVMMSVITKRWLMFAVPLVGCLGGVCMPIIRARMSQLVDANEQGALFAAVATMETLCTLCGAAIFNSLYSVSVRQFNFKGFCFLVMAALMIVPSVIIGLLKCSESKEGFKHTGSAERESEHVLKDTEDRSTQTSSSPVIP